MRVLISGSRGEYWERLFPVFVRHGMQPVILEEFSAVVKALRNAPPALVVVDAGADDAANADAHIQKLRETLAALLAANAMVHAAVVSFLPEETLHDALEGLGILGGMPASPTEEDIAALAQTLNTVNGLTLGSS